MVLVTRKRVIDDITRVARQIAKNRTGIFSRNEYRRLGKFASSTVEARFGTFTKAVKAAGVRNTVTVR